MEVKVRFFTVLREITGKKEETLQFPESSKVTMETAVRVLAERYGKPFSDYVYDPATGKARGFLQFFVNGQAASALKGLDTELHDCDLLAIVPPVGGG